MIVSEAPGQSHWRRVQIELMESVMQTEDKRSIVQPGEMDAYLRDR
jgi:hypothetical protein